jgi:hypothetical protein
MKLMMFVLGIVVLSLSSCFPVPVPVAVGHSHRSGYVRSYSTVRINAPRPHYNGGHYGGHNRGGGRPRGWR